MATPQIELYQLLAESNQRAKACLKIGKSAADSISQRHQQMQAEMEELRQLIYTQGIGIDPASEDRYLELLRDFRSLHQSHELSKQLPTLPEESVEDKQLQKALDYGQMLLDVYSGGLLVKAASGDITAHISRLQQWPHPKALAIIRKLKHVTRITSTPDS